MIRASTRHEEYRPKRAGCSQIGNNKFRPCNYSDCRGTMKHTDNKWICNVNSKHRIRVKKGV